MTDSLTIALAQLNPTVGDIDGNVARIRAARAAAAAGGADLVVGTELCVSLEYEVPPGLYNSLSNNYVIRDAMTELIREQTRAIGDALDKMGRGH